MQETENKISSSIADFPPITGLEPVELIGNTGIGKVYKAKQSSGDRQFAVRVIPAIKLGNDGVSNFLANSKSCAGLKHPNVVNIHAINKTKSGDIFIVTDYLGTRTLKSVLKDTNSQLKKQQIGKLLCELIAGLDYLHRGGIVHKRLNPNNVMLIEEKNELLVKIVDYELAKNLGFDMSKPEFMPSNAAYMSPEQCLNREVDVRSDVYSTACIIFESLSGQAPFSGANRQELMYKQISGAVPSVALMQMFAGAPLAELLHLSLSKNPEDRMNSASRFRDSFEKALSLVPETFDKKKFEKQLKTESTQTVNTAHDERGAKNTSQTPKHDPLPPSSQPGVPLGSTGGATQGSSANNAAEKPSHGKASTARQKALEAEALEEKRSPLKAIFIFLAVTAFLLLILKDSILPFLVKPEKPPAETSTSSPDATSTSSSTSESPAAIPENPAAKNNKPTNESTSTGTSATSAETPATGTAAPATRNGAGTGPAQSAPSSTGSGAPASDSNTAPQ